MKPSTIFGLAAGGLAAVSWSLGFIVPFVIGDYSVFDFTLVEFVLSGLLGVGLLFRKAKLLSSLRAQDWLVACLLGLIGYVGYFLAVMGAAVYAGPVVAPAFLGLVPVVLAIAGNFRQRTVSWKSLTLPLLLACVGLSLVNGSDLARAGALETRSLALGIALAFLAVTLWTAFGLLNESALAKRPTMDAGVWTALIMAGAGASMLVFLPIGLLLGLFEFPRIGLQGSAAAPLWIWAGALAVLANIGGALAWTFAAQRLPIALSAQLITLEPASATILGLVVHRRWPSLAEALGMCVLLIGVVLAIGVFSRPLTGAKPAAI